MTSWSKNEPYPLLWGLCLPVRYYDWTTYQPILRENSKRVRLTESLLLSSFCHILCTGLGHGKYITDAAWRSGTRNLKTSSFLPLRWIMVHFPFVWWSHVIPCDPQVSPGHGTTSHLRHRFLPASLSSLHRGPGQQLGIPLPQAREGDAWRRFTGICQWPLPGKPPGTWLHIQKIALSCHSLEWTLRFHRVWHTFETTNCWCSMGKNRTEKL